jgi:hypothetical protein
MNGWPFVHFVPEEFACKCCGLMVVDFNLLQMVEDVRTELGVPFVITSGTRCENHNAEVGGARASAHLPKGGVSHAVDIKCVNDVLRGKMAEAFYKKGIRRMEASDMHLHVDNADYLPAPMLKAVVFRKS